MGVDDIPFSDRRDRRAGACARGGREEQQEERRRPRCQLDMPLPCMPRGEIRNAKADASERARLDRTVEQMPSKLTA